MAIIFIDDKKYVVDESQNILKNCLSLGINIPYFCWHPTLGSIGSCRQCAVIMYNNQDDLKGRIVMSCMTPSLNNTRISVDTAEVNNFRRNILELLMLNHPHDCPICSEAGNCHLQDMTVMTQHRHRRFRFPKRTYKNQYLGPFITHEMNRCITCYRCVRFYKDYAQGTDFNVYGMANSIYFGRLEDGSLENEHSGNLIEICPTGVFTDKTNVNNYSRKWDLQCAPSVCSFCSIGCNIIAGERNGELNKIDNRYNKNVNEHFICDLGRFGYGFVNLKNRPNKPMLYKNDKNIYLNVDQAIEQASIILKDSSKILGIGSSRSSIENNFSLVDLVGINNFSAGMLKDELDCINFIIEVLKSNKFNIPTLSEIESYDAIIIIGEDVTYTSPRIDLSLRQAIRKLNSDLKVNNNVDKWNNLAVLNISQDFKNPLFITNVKETKLDDLSTWNYIANIPDQIKFVAELANKIKNSFYSVKLPSNFLINKVELISKTLVSAKKPLVITGSHSRSFQLLQSSVYLAEVLKQVNQETSIVLLSANANSIGSCILKARSIEEVISIFLKVKDSVLILMENDLYRYLPVSQVNSIFKNSSRIIVIDHQKTKSMKKAGLMLPSTNFFESSGTIINYEGRAQRFFQVYDPGFYDKNIVRKDSWRWLHFIKSKRFLFKIRWNKLDDIISDCVLRFPILKEIRNAAPNSSFRIVGQKIPRSPHRFSGRTSLRTHIDVHESRQPEDSDTMFAFSMEGSNQFNQYSSHIPYIWNPGWNSPQAWNKFSNNVSLSNSVGMSSGVRLFHDNRRTIQYKFQEEENVLLKNNQLKVVVYYLFFGSEEMSQRSPVIKKCIKKVYGIVNSLDAKYLRLKTGILAEFNYQKESFFINIKLSHCFPRGCIGLPLGNSGIPFSLFGKIVEYLREVK